MSLPWPPRAKTANFQYLPWTQHFPQDSEPQLKCPQQDSTQGQQGQLQINPSPAASQGVASSVKHRLSQYFSSPPNGQTKLPGKDLISSLWLRSLLRTFLVQPHNKASCLIPSAEGPSELTVEILHCAWGRWAKPLKDWLVRDQGWEPLLYFKSLIISARGFRHLGRSQGSL